MGDHEICRVRNGGYPLTVHRYSDGGLGVSTQGEKHYFITQAQAREMALAILEATGGLPGTHAAYERGWKDGSGELAEEAARVARTYRAGQQMMCEELSEPMQCPACNGTGNTGFISTVRCERCNGTGQA